jgi:uncharacterized integral membrane protein
MTTCAFCANNPTKPSRDLIVMDGKVVCKSRTACDKRLKQLARIAKPKQSRGARPPKPKGPKPVTERQRVPSGRIQLDMGSWPSWLRWLAALPTAVIGMVITKTIFFFLGYLGDTVIGGQSVVWLSLGDVLGPAVFVLGGAVAAPTQRLATGLVFALFVVFAVHQMYQIGVVYFPQASAGPAGWVITAESVLGAILGVGGLAGIAVRRYREDVRTRV